MGADELVEGQLSDRVALISTCLSAFASIAASISTSQREDIRSVAILLYSGISFGDLSLP